MINSFFDLIYPPLCLHCQTTLNSGRDILCHSCISLLEFIDCNLHCSKCFSLAYAPKHSCKNCSLKRSSLTAIAATFDYRGPPETLIKMLKYHDKPYLAEGLAGFMAAQFVSLDWPIPDLIIPVPQSFSHWYTRGYNQAELLSNSLSTILKCPVKNALSRKSDDYSQASLNYSQRLRLSGNSIYLKKNQHLQDKIILLIDDVLTTGATLQNCAEALLEDCPNSIYALTICYANYKETSLKLELQKFIKEDIPL